MRRDSKGQSRQEAVFADDAARPDVVTRRRIRDVDLPGQVPEVGATLPLLAQARLTWLRHVVGPVRRRVWRRPPMPPPLTAQQILDRLAALQVCTWSYEFEPGVRHMGPMAQDFAAAFGLGRTNRMIEEVDANGVALVTIQVLYRRVVALEAECGALRRQIGIESAAQQ